MSSDKRDLYNGFGDSLARAFEIVFTPFVFGAIGWWLDGRLGTRPVLALTLGILVLLVTLWKLAAGYGTSIDIEARKAMGRTGEEPAP